MGRKPLPVKETLPFGDVAPGEIASRAGARGVAASTVRTALPVRLLVVPKATTATGPCACDEGTTKPRLTKVPPASAVADATTTLFTVIRTSSPGTKPTPDAVILAPFNPADGLSDSPTEFEGAEQHDGQRGGRQGVARSAQRGHAVGARRGSGGQGKYIAAERSACARHDTGDQVCRSTAPVRSLPPSKPLPLITTWPPDMRVGGLKENCAEKMGAAAHDRDIVTAINLLVTPTASRVCISRQGVGGHGQHQGAKGTGRQHLHGPLENPIKENLYFLTCEKA